MSVCWQRAVSRGVHQNARDCRLSTRLAGSVSRMRHARTLAPCVTPFERNSWSYSFVPHKHHTKSQIYYWTDNILCGSREYRRSRSDYCVVGPDRYQNGASSDRAQQFGAIFTCNKLRLIIFSVTFISDCAKRKRLLHVLCYGFPWLTLVSGVLRSNCVSTYLSTSFVYCPLFTRWSNGKRVNGFVCTLSDSW